MTARNGERVMIMAHCIPKDLAVRKVHCIGIAQGREVEFSRVHSGRMFCYT